MRMFSVDCLVTLRDPLELSYVLWLHSGYVLVTSYVLCKRFINRAAWDRGAVLVLHGFFFFVLSVS